MPLPPGTRLGPYEIVGSLGEGGMGEVYKARDTRLDRTVAVKIVRNWGGADHERRERFAREAKLLASLDHPHICPVHDVGREQDVDYLVMPHLSGETLAARLKKGPLPLPFVIEIASQIGDALDRAHRLGIVHRDLKPANVMLTSHGPRLLDFGLAGLDTPDADHPEAATRPVLTTVGTTMGTLPYMAPEQLSGGRVDVRADVWAFGCLIYEMVTGRQPFRAASDDALMRAILSAEPEPLGAGRTDVPPMLDAIVRGALMKEREERWQSVHDMTRTLGLVRVHSGPPDTAMLVARRVPVGFWIGAALLTLAALGAGVFLRRGAADAGVVRFNFDAGLGTIATFTDISPYFAASPDGTRIAYTASVGGRADIWIKDIRTAAAERVPDTTGASSPFWSPDSKSIAFLQGSDVKRKALSGGPPQLICKISGIGINGAWGSGGDILIAEWGTLRLWRVPETGGEPIATRESQDDPIGWPVFLPDGRHFLAVTVTLGKPAVSVAVGSLDSKDLTPVPGVTSRVGFANGHLFFWRDGSLMAQPFDTVSFKLSGEPVAIADEIHAFNVTAFAAFSVSDDLIVYQAGPTVAGLVWTDRRGVVLDSPAVTGDLNSIRLSPDGTRVAYSGRDPRLGSGDIFIHEFNGNFTRRLTSDPGTENGPIWSPDGKTIIYSADRHGPPNLHIRSADGVGEEREIVPPMIGGPQGAGSTTPDGRVIFTAFTAGNDRDVFIAPLDGKGAPTPLVHTKWREQFPRASVDGGWLAYVSNESGRNEVYVQPLEDPKGRRQISRNGGTNPMWRKDGRELFYLGGAGDQVFAVEMTDGTPGAPKLLFARPSRVLAYDAAADGERFLFIAEDRYAERGTLSVILHWPALSGLVVKHP